MVNICVAATSFVHIADCMGLETFEEIMYDNLRMVDLTLRQFLMYMLF